MLLDRDRSHWIDCKVTKRDTSYLQPHLLRSTIFAINEADKREHRLVPKFDDVTDLSDGAAVSYVGPVLRQFDLRVLLRLINLVGGKPATKEHGVVTFHAEAFLQSIRRDTSTRMVEALRSSLVRLRAATFTVRTWRGACGEVFGFVSSADWTHRSFKVVMDPKAHWAMDSIGHTYVNLDARFQLNDGVETALADLIRSSKCTSFDIPALAQLWGRDSIKEVGRDVRRALPKLVSVGLIRGWSKTRNRVHVHFES